MKLLAVGDIHLGRTPSRLSAALTSEFTPRELGPSEAWKRTVEFAISEKVEAVLLAGDVVEQKDDFFEAYRDLKEGVERLADAQIRVLGVSGNHDVVVLPQLARAVADFRLLGEGGVWESVELGPAERIAVSVLGWSFPREQVNHSPLESIPARRGDGHVIGLLHCDRDQTHSPYAPVRSSELRAAPVDAWLLGHIHKPDPLDGPGPMGYLGSLSGLDPGEPGPHGPWMIDVGTNGISASQVPLAPLRWEVVEVDVSALEGPDALPTLILDAVGGIHAQIVGSNWRPKAVGCRVRLTGRTSMGRPLEEKLANDDPRMLVDHKDDIAYFIHDIRIEVEPDVDLAEMARTADLVGLLARRVLALRDPSSKDGIELIEKARGRLAAVGKQPNLRALGELSPEDGDVRALLEAAALRAIDRLMSQREAES